MLLRALCAATLVCQIGVATAADAPGAQRWDLRDLYPTPAAWDSAYGVTRERILALAGLQPMQGANATALLRTLAAISDAQQASARLAAYAFLQGDEDLREAPAQERRSQAQALLAPLDEKTSWVAPAVQALADEKVRGWIAAEPALKARFDFYLAEVLRNLPHTLSAEDEALLAASGIVLAQPNNVFQQLSEAELPRPQVTLSTGKSLTWTTDAYELSRHSPVRADRKAIFDAYFGGWQKFEGTFGANLAAQVPGDVFTARARRFDGALETSLFANDMPPVVYRTLVAQANAGLPTLHRYLWLRQKMLGRG